MVYVAIKYLMYFCVIGACFITHIQGNGVPKSLYFTQNYNTHNYFIHNFVHTEKVKYVKNSGEKYVAIIENKKGERFIVKQKGENRVSCAIRIACEKLGAHVAQSVNILVNKVEIIPAFYKIPGKKFEHLPATIHSFVPGISAQQLPSSLGYLKGSIRQLMKLHTPQKYWGLTRWVINHMAVHIDLCRMVALDTFIGNADRNRKNYFYDEQTDRFYAIDLESSFKKQVAFYAYRCIKSIGDHKNILSQQELKALIVYRDTLKELLSLHTPETLYQTFVEFFKEAAGDSTEIRQAAAEKLAFYHMSMHNNYASCRELVGLLDHLILKNLQ